MNLEECDRYCDQYEARLQKGDRLSAEAFLRESGLPSDKQLLTELHRLEREYGISRGTQSQTPLDPAPRRKRTGILWVLGVSLLAISGMGVALFQARAAKSRAVEELHQKDAEIEKLSQQFEAQKSERDRQIKFEDALAGLARRIAESPGNGPEAVWNEMLEFWDRTIEADDDRHGRSFRPPGHADSPWDRMSDPAFSAGRGDFYRLQRALCLARLGDHDAAFQQAQVLERRTSQQDQHLPDLVRLYAISAAKASAQSGSDKFYRDAAMAHLRNAAALAETPPLEADDPELSVLRSEPDFHSLLAQWRANYSKKRLRTK